MSDLNWDDLLTSNFVKLETGKPKKMVLSGWRAQDKFKDNEGNIRPGIEFQVTNEDGKEYAGEKVKTWTVTAIRAMVMLKPLIEKAEAEGKTQISVSVVRVGDGKQTTYSINEA